MSLVKSNLNINFMQGLDLKNDPLQVQPGKFLALENSVFDKLGRLTKRNGYGFLPGTLNTDTTFLTTFNGNLTAVGSQLQAYSQGSEMWVTKGTVQPASLSVLPLIRSNVNQIQSDTAISESGIVCTVYTETTGPSTSYKYAIADSTTGQNIIAPTAFVVPAGAVSGSPRVFLLGSYFYVVLTVTISGVNHLQGFAISTANPSLTTPVVNISSVYTPNSRVNFDGAVSNDSLVLAWNGSDIGGAIRLIRVSSHLALSAQVVFTGHTADIMSVCVDASGSTDVFYATFWDSSSTNGFTLAVNQNLSTIHAPTQVITGEIVDNIATQATGAICTIVYEINLNYSYTSAPSHYLKKNTITQPGVVGTASVLVRSLGLASKMFTISGVQYVMGIYYSVYQPTYFVVDMSGNVVIKLAASNGGNYIILGLPSVSVSGQTAQVSYLIKDLLESVNKTQNASSPTGVYAQLGINLAKFVIGLSAITTAEIGGNLNLSGGILWSYDGYSAVEQGFNVYPDTVDATTSTTGGNLTAQDYFYQVTYAWTDNQGNIFRSAPSVPKRQTTTGSTSANTINIPTLRLTYKTANPVKIVIYRWSTAQQTYYQITSTAAPLLNNPAVDSVSFVDTQADSAIIGNSIIYTTGGVIENIGPPATNVMTLFDNRLWLVDAEDPNLLWYSKQVIEATPVEMSDLLTIYAAPTFGAQGSTGETKAMAPLDDKLILFKRDAIYYISGRGPDNTGANSQYSDAIFVTATVGCSNQHSIAFIPQGLMFQSDKGIWLLGRDLSTNYIGAPVESLTTGNTVKSAVSIPGTNQIRFTMSSGITIVYDYFVGQWCTFTNVPAIASTLYQNLHTFVDQYGRAFQETPDAYLDGTIAVTMSFTTSWFNLMGLQGYQRAYWFYLLGSYISPHKLSISIAYDYNPSPSQVTAITPDNYNNPWGGEALWGSGATWGGNTDLEQWRIFLTQQRCESFQITVKEVYDSTYGQVAGAGLTISGLNLIVGAKSNRTTLKAARSAG